MPKFMVIHNYLYGWDDADWHDEGKPWRFDTREEAQAEIDDFIKSTQEAFERGDMSEPYDPDDYAIVEVDG